MLSCSVYKKVSTLVPRPLSNYKKAQNVCYWWLLTIISWAPLSILGLVFGSSFFYWRLPSLLVVMTIFGKSRDLKTKTPKTQVASIFFPWNKCQRIECIQMQNWRKDLLKLFYIIYWKSYDVTKTLWRHYFLGNTNHNKPIRQFLLLNALYLLAFVPSKKEGSCQRFRSFCFQVMWLTKYGQVYLKWWQPPIEERWPKTNPRILRDWIQCMTVRSHP